MLKRLSVIIILLLLSSGANAADKQQQFDLACAIVAGAKMGDTVNKTGDGNLITLLALYLGRLSGRDDTKDWNKIALGRAAELQEKALDDGLLKTCINLFVLKTQ
jgi:hypothetical protein